MIWIAPSEKNTDNAALEKRLWDTADQFRANSGRKAQEYSGPILGIVFLRFAEVRFPAQRVVLKKSAGFLHRGSRADATAAYYAGPMARYIIQRCCTIQNPHRTRDLLLPRLLSGQVELKAEAA